MHSLSAVAGMHLAPAAPGFFSSADVRVCVSAVKFEGGAIYGMIFRYISIIH